MLDALKNLSDWLSGNGTAYKTSTYYTQIKSYFPVEADARSFALRLIIHYVGDIHQPLHAVAEVDSTYPSGDKGGNAESIPSKSGANNLHAVWDSVAYEYAGTPVLPLSNTDWSWYTTTEQTLASQYKVDKTKLHDYDFAYWAQESYDLAVSTVYPGVVPGQALSDAYVTKAREALHSSIMYGGNRLSDLIKTIYAPKATGFL